MDKDVSSDSKKAFRVFVTIKPGVDFPAKHDLTTALADRKIVVSTHADYVLWCLERQRKLASVAGDIELDLVSVSVSELGLSKATRKQIYSQALRRGLKYCPPKSGLQIPFQNETQPEHSAIIAMEDAVFGYIDEPEILRWDRGEDGQLSLRCACGSFDEVFDSDTCFIFVQPR